MIGITNYFNSFLNILAVFIPPIVGVVAVDYFVIKKGNPAAWAEKPGFNLAGVIAWIVGSAIALLLPELLIPTLNAIVIACILYLILYPIFYRGNRTGVE